MPNGLKVKLFLLLQVDLEGMQLVLAFSFTRNFIFTRCFVEAVLQSYPLSKIESFEVL